MPPIRDNKELGDNRHSATMKPITVAKTMPITETRIVFNKPTKNTRQ